MSDFDLNSLLGDSELDIDCPNCHAKVTFTLKDVGKTVKCRKCSTEIKLNKNPSYDKSIKSVNKSFKDFEKTLKNLGK